MLAVRWCQVESVSLGNRPGLCNEHFRGSCAFSGLVVESCVQQQSEQTAWLMQLIVC